MIAKGKISAIYPNEKTMTVILPEYDNIVTRPLKIYGGTKPIEQYQINEPVIVALFNLDFYDAVVLGK